MAALVENVVVTSERSAEAVPTQRVAVPERHNETTTGNSAVVRSVGIVPIDPVFSSSVTAASALERSVETSSVAQWEKPDAREQGPGVIIESGTAGNEPTVPFTDASKKAALVVLADLAGDATQDNSLAAKKPLASDDKNGIARADTKRFGPDTAVRGVINNSDADNKRPPSDEGERPAPKRSRPDVTRTGVSNTRPSFLPADLCAPRSDCDLPDAKRAAIDAFLDSCSEFAGLDGPSADRPSFSGVQNDEWDYNQREYIPTETTFWRDGEKVVLNDGDDGLSTDYLVASVFRSVWKTLKSFTLCRNSATVTASAGKALRDMLRVMEHDVREVESSGATEKRYSHVVSMIKNLALAVDTSKGSRKCVVNQLKPVSCNVANLNRLCRFNGFGAVNDWGYLECNFNIPIKLVFLGTLEIQKYGTDTSADYALAYKIEPSRYFGSYFYSLLEELYDTCFKTLETQVYRYKKKKEAREAQYRQAVAGFDNGGGSVSSPVERFITSGRLVGRDPTGRFGWDPSALDGFFDRLPELVRKDDIRIVGTTGIGKSQKGLRYIRYDGDEETVTEVDPEEDVDAVFVSSFIRFRIREDGTVHMDVFTRHAIQLETDETVDK